MCSTWRARAWGPVASYPGPEVAFGILSAPTLAPQSLSARRDHTVMFASIPIALVPPVRLALPDAVQVLRRPDEDLPVRDRRRRLARPVVQHVARDFPKLP